MEKNKSIDHATMRKPRVGVGAVVFRGDSVLLIKRAKPPMQGYWSIPGGKLDYGEALKDAAIREVVEETGCAIEITGMIDVFEALPSDPDQHDFLTVMIDYVANWVSGEPAAADDAAAAEFVPIDEALKRLSWDETRRALQLALEKRR